MFICVGVYQLMRICMWMYADMCVHNGIRVCHCDRYPTGGDSISISSGVVSRVEVQRYAHGGGTQVSVHVQNARVQAYIYICIVILVYIFVCLFTYIYVYILMVVCCVCVACRSDRCANKPW